MQRGKPDEPDGCEESDPAETDLQLSMKMLDKGKLTGNVGVLITPHDQWTIGLSVMPPIDVEGKGHIEAKFSDDHWLNALLEDGETRDDEIRVLMKLPLVIRSGVQFKPQETLAIKFAAVYEHWSRSEETRIEDVRAPLTLNSTATALHRKALIRRFPSRVQSSSRRTTETASATGWEQSGTRNHGSHSAAGCTTKPVLSPISRWVSL